MNPALLPYTSAEAIYRHRLLSGLELSANEGSHDGGVVAFSRAGPVSPDATDADDRAVARFKTRAIHERVLTHVLALSADDTRQLYGTFRAGGGGGGLLRGTAAFSDLLFEAWAVRHVFDEYSPHHFPLLHHRFAPMDEQAPLPDTDMGARRRRPRSGSCATAPPSPTPRTRTRTRRTSGRRSCSTTPRAASRGGGGIPRAIYRERCQCRAWAPSREPWHDLGLGLRGWRFDGAAQL